VGLHDDTAHDEVGGRHLGVLGSVPRAARLLAVRIPVGFRVRPNLFDRAEHVLERPPDQADARSRQADLLLAQNGRGGQAGVLPQVLRRHQRQLEVVLDQHAANHLSLVGFVQTRGRNLSQPADNLGGLVGFEGDAQFLGVCRAEDFGFRGFVGVEREQLGFEPHDVVFLAVHQDLELVSATNQMVGLHPQPRGPRSLR
jgi:hypothetical protein